MQGQGGGPPSRRAFLAGALGTGLATSLAAAGCGMRTGDLGDGTGEIIVWTWPDNDKTFNVTKKSFEKKFPHIKVTVQGFSGTYNSKVLGAMVSGTGPDVAMIEITSISNFQAKPGFVDLSKAPYDAGRYADRYARFAWEYVHNSETGSIFQLPKNTGPGGMFYRRDVLADAGLPTDPAGVHEAFATWDDFIKAGKKVVRKGKRWLVDHPGDVVTAVRAQRGVSYFDAHGNQQLTSAEMIDAMEMIPRMESAGIVAPSMTDPERASAMAAGTVATFFSGNWFGGWLKSTYAPKTSGKWGVALAPASDGISAFNSGGDFIGVLESSRNKLAAWEFVRWVTQDASSLHQMYLRDLYPAWMPATTASWINKPDPYYHDQNVNQVFREVSRTMKTPVTNPNDALAATAFSNAVVDVQSGYRTPRAALKKAADDLESKMG